MALIHFTDQAITLQAIIVMLSWHYY